MSRIVNQITVVGIGSAGCNTVTRLYDMNVSQNAKLVAVHTEEVHLEKSRADEKVLVGERVTHGRGTGGVVSVGARVMTEDLSSVISKVGSPKTLIVCGGLGGGMGSGGMPVLLEYYKEKYPDILRLVVTTFPFKFEGLNRKENATHGLTRLMDLADLTVLNLNDILFESIREYPMMVGFKLLDLILALTIKGMVDIITKGGDIGISYGDFEAVSRNAGLGMVGHGTGVNVREAVENAISNVYLDGVGTSDSYALVYVATPENVTMGEASIAPDTVSKKYEVTRMFWGHRIESRNNVQVMLLVSNVQSDSVTSVRSGFLL